MRSGSARSSWPPESARSRGTGCASSASRRCLRSTACRRYGHSGQRSILAIAAPGESSRTAAEGFPLRTRHLRTAPPSPDQGVWPAAPASAFAPWQSDRTSGVHGAAQRVLPLALGGGTAGTAKVTAYPARADDAPDERPRTYTDAAATRPAALAFSLAGGGFVWAQDGPPELARAVRAFRPGWRRAGLAVKGAHVAAARAGLATALLTILWPRPVHLGVDASYVIRGHEAVCARLRGLGPAKPWGLAPNGVLWELWQNALVHRGVASLRLSKVKGHANEEDVTDAADEMAAVGVESHDAACRADAASAGDRHTAHRKFVARTQTFHLEVLADRTCMVRQLHCARHRPAGRRPLTSVRAWSSEALPGAGVGVPAVHLRSPLRGAAQATRTLLLWRPSSSLSFPRAYRKCALPTTPRRAHLPVDVCLRPRRPHPAGPRCCPAGPRCSAQRSTPMARVA